MEELRMKDEFLLTKTRDLLNQILSKWNYESDINTDKYFAIYDGVQLVVKDDTNDIWATTTNDPWRFLIDFNELFELNHYSTKSDSDTRKSLIKLRDEISLDVMRAEVKVENNFA